MDALEAIMTRRSIRRFTDAEVGEAEVDTILRAAMAAPSASNEQPWRFVVVREKEALERLSRATPFARPLRGAAVGIIVCGDKRAAKYPGFWVIDCAAATENALVAAHALGLGGVWIGVHPVPPFVSAVRRAIGAPRGVVPHSMIALGRPAEARQPADRFQPGFVHAEVWREA